MIHSLATRFKDIEVKYCTLLAIGLSGLHTTSTNAAPYYSLVSATHTVQGYGGTPIIYTDDVYIHDGDLAPGPDPHTGSYSNQWADQDDDITYVYTLYTSTHATQDDVFSVSSKTSALARGAATLNLNIGSVYQIEILTPCTVKSDARSSVGIEVFGSTGGTGIATANVDGIGVATQLEDTDTASSPLVILDDDKDRAWLTLNTGVYNIVLFTSIYANVSRDDSQYSYVADYYNYDAAGIIQSSPHAQASSSLRFYPLGNFHNEDGIDDITLIKMNYGSNDPFYDLNFDGSVDIRDVMVIDPTVGDFDSDGDVDVDDLDYLLDVADPDDPADTPTQAELDMMDLDGDGDVDFTGHQKSPEVNDDVDIFIRYVLGTEYADANLDGKVDTLDLSALASNFNQPATSWAQADFNHDGVTDLLDLSIRATYHGFDNTVPEPASMAVMALGTTALLRR